MLLLMDKQILMKALALAGDLTTCMVLRDNILLVRTMDGKMEKVQC